MSDVDTIGPQRAGDPRGWLLFEHLPKELQDAEDARLGADKELARNSCTIVVPAAGRRTAGPRRDRNPGLDRRPNLKPQRAFSNRRRRPGHRVDARGFRRSPPTRARSTSSWSHQRSWPDWSS